MGSSSLLDDALQLQGRSGLNVDVELESGFNRLKTDAKVTIEQVLGQDQFADTWVALGTLADCSTITAGDTLRIQIAQGCSTEFPAVDVTSTVQAADVAADVPEIAFAERVISDLQSDSNFNDHFKASRNQSNSTIFATSRIIGEFGERPNANDFQVTTTGTLTHTLGFNNILRRSKSTSLNADPRDPRVGVLGISGTVSTIPSAVGDTYLEFAEDVGTSTDLRVNGSVTPVDFFLTADADSDTFVNTLRFAANGNGIQFGKFLTSNQNLTNGIELQVKSDDTIYTYPLFKQTDDFKHVFSDGPASWLLDIQSGADDLTSTRAFTNPFPIRRVGAFGAGNDDYVRVRIQDRLDNIGLQSFHFLGFGFKQEV